MKKHIKLISIIALLLIIIISGTYAFYAGRVNKPNGNNTASFVAKYLKLEFSDGPEIILNDVLPGQKIIKMFSVTNTGTETLEYNLAFIDVNNTFTRKSDLVYTITSTNNGFATENEVKIPSKDTTFAKNITIDPNDTQEYVLTIEYKNLDENQSVDMGKSANLTINITDTNTVYRNDSYAGDSILGILADNDDFDDDVYRFVVNNQTYNVHVIPLAGNQVITTDTTYGSLEDCAIGDSAEDMAKNMVVVYVDGNYTINSGVTVGPTYSESYGGPKGFTLFVTGTLTNNGTIENTHGAYANGEDVYLYKSNNGIYEYVPAVGADGGASLYNGSTSTGKKGLSGKDATERQLAGGGSGGVYNGDSSVSHSGYSGKGGIATSYSGGAGGGAVSNNTQGNTYYGGNASNNGVGGNANAHRQDSSWSTRNASGGAGAIHGMGSVNGSLTADGKGNSGAGGLLVIYADSFANTGAIDVSGSEAKAYGNAQGGSSGGGSINIFANHYTNTFSQLTNASNVLGGISTFSQNAKGGDGGTGSLSVSVIENGNCYNYKYYQYGPVIQSNSITDFVKDEINANGTYVAVVNGVYYPIHAYYFGTDQVWDVDQTFGTQDDVGTASNYAEAMVVVKVDGNLTNNANIGPFYNEYGGPKGFLLYVSGTLTNNGTIDNSHGAYAKGEYVYLYKNADDSYELIEPTGGTGGASKVSSSTDAYLKGNIGNNGTGRNLGGGGSGGLLNGDCSGIKSTSGAGGNATSYSGGTGGGGINQNSYTSYSAEKGSDDGGIGGKAYAYRYSSSWASRAASGGAGNPNGMARSNGSDTPANQGSSGTGGLLIIYANTLTNTNNGTFTANGHIASTNGVVSGGSSGGGSINIFANTITNSYSSLANACSVTGGISTGNGTGGDGGSGTVNIGTISNGSYTSLN